MEESGDPEDTGKDGGKDAASGKSTFVSTMGKEQARTRVEMLVGQACRHLNIFGSRADTLKEMGEQVLERRA